jgi:cellulose synthase/poly-beta-1,6-N-acetylglucosamine synthase-like glycosyltransferase
VTAAHLVLGISVAACVYAYAGYPLVLAVLGRLRPRPVRYADEPCTVSVVCAAYNEEATIATKIRNTLALDYPPAHLELIVASDGSTDATNRIVRDAGDPRIRLLELPRRGKLHALHAAVEAATGDVLLLTDANIELDPDALSRMTRAFADPDVGGVCASKRFHTGGNATGDGEGMYWRYDQWVKTLENRVGSIYGADGACYAIRRRLFEPVDDPAQADDLAISARVALQGYRLIYERDAVCREEAPADGLAELRRKIRVANHSMRAVLNLRGRLRQQPLYAWQLISHKPVRHLVPVSLVLALISSAVLSLDSVAFRMLLLLQLAFYALAVLGWAARSTAAGRHPMFRVPFYFSLMNTAAGLALLELVRGRRRTAWTPRGDAS